MIKPAKLKIGDLIGIISPASTVDDYSKIESGIAYLENKGYNVIKSKNLAARDGFLAGTDEQRIADLHEMFANTEVKAIICLRGGYGTGRLLNKINYDLIQDNPKIISGYSDLTALLNAITKRTGLVTFFGPMLAPDFADNPDLFTKNSFWQLINGHHILELPYPDNLKPNIMVNGKAEGELAGGNLAVLTSIAGTNYFPDWKGKILILEDVGEAPYRIDRMLNHLKLSGVFEQVSGLILGAFTNCIDKDNSSSQSVGEVLRYYFQDSTFPVMYNFPFGHIRRKLTIPIGIKIRLDTYNNSITFLEQAVL